MSEAASSHKKKHVRKAEPETDPEFQIAPMIDILLVLLVFFMSISTTEVLQSNRNIQLPVARDASPSKKNVGQTIINVTHSLNGPGIEIDQQSFTVAELQGRLQDKVRANPQMRVVIRGDKEVKYEFLRTLLETVGKAGVGNVTFSVASKEGQQ